MNLKQLNLKHIAIQLAFLILGLYLFYTALNGASIDTLISYVLDIKIGPLFLILLSSLAAHMIRTYRWKLLMDTQGKSSFWVLCFAIHSAYFASLFIPRIGELLKCVVTSEIERKPIAFILGTNILERITDIIIYGVLLAICLFIKFDFIAALFLSSINTLQPKSFIILAITGSILLLIAAYLYKKLKEKKLVHQIIDGLQSFSKVENKTGFVLSSIAIYICYFLTSYLAFFCYDATMHLGPLDGFIVMVCGAFTRMLPISGGSIGAYHFVVQKVMTTFGINDQAALSYAILNHGFQLVYTTVFGIISYLILSGKLRKKR